MISTTITMVFCRRDAPSKNVPSYESRHQEPFPAIDESASSADGRSKRRGYVTSSATSNTWLNMHSRSAIRHKDGQPSKRNAGKHTVVLSSDFKSSFFFFFLASEAVAVGLLVIARRAMVVDL